MSIQGKEELFDEKGSLPVWGHVGSGGKIYYKFQLTKEDGYIMFPVHFTNPNAPKFVLRKIKSVKEGEEE